MVLANDQFAETLLHGVRDQILSSSIPDWTMPSENGEPPRTPFVMNHFMAGLWKGTLMNDGATLAVQLNIQSSEVATIAVGFYGPENLSHMQSEGPALLGIASGIVIAPDALQIGARKIRVKVIPHEGRLIGRVTALSGPVDEPLATLSFVINLNRAL